MVNTKDILIAVMGMTGAGKSTFIGTATGSDTKVGHGLHACTQTIEVVQFQLRGYTIHLIDTPGFDDTERSDTEILEHITAWLQVSYDTSALLSGIIYLHRLTDNRITGSAMKNLRMFRKLCGSKYLANVLLVTTMWENMKYPGDGERREKELVGVGKFWGGLIAMGSKACRHDGTKESALTIIEGLLDKEPVTLHIQEELSRGVALGDTEAGRAVLDELALKAREREAELRELKQQMQESMANSTRESQQMLAQQRAEYDELLRRKENDLQERLRLSEANSEHLRQRLLESERRRSRSRCVVM